MSNAAADRLDAVTKDLHQALEARFGDLLGTIRAAETVGRQIQSLDDEIRRVTMRGDRARAGGDAETASALEDELAELEGMREQQVEDLAALAGRVHG